MRYYRVWINDQPFTIKQPVKTLDLLEYISELSRGDEYEDNDMLEDDDTTLDLLSDNLY